MTTPSNEDALVGDPGCSWADLEDIHRNCQALAATPVLIADYMRNRELVAKVENQDLLLRSAQILQRDSKDYIDSLAAIFDRHSDRAGPIEDPDQHAAFIELSQEYTTWYQSYKSVVYPTIETLTDLFAKAGEQLPPLPAAVDSLEDTMDAPNDHA